MARPAGAPLGAGASAGMVSAELALALPVVILVLALSLAAVAAATDQLRCVDAARVAARAAVRGDAAEDVLGAARRSAPPEAVITIRGDRAVTVTVSAPARAIAAWLPIELRPSASVTAIREGAP